MTINRLAKLRAMPPREIAHRVAYEAFTAIERRSHARGSLARPGRLHAALVSPVRDASDWRERLSKAASTRRFFAWEDQPDLIRDLFQTQYRDELARSREVAAGVARHEIAFFGETFRFGAEIDWHADPVTGAGWPRSYHRDVPVAGGNSGFGDVKYVWELNRHQFFVDLAKVAFLDRSQSHADSLHALLKSWNAAVPYATGAPWACALEPAFRAWSWMWAYRMVLASGLLDTETHLLWLTGLFDHARFLHRHLERYASPYNHLIGEASALFALGLLLPEIGESRAWTERGRAILESTVGDQFHADGGTVEQSTFYHHATLGFYLLAAVLGRRCGADLSARVYGAIERGVEFSQALMQPDGRLPRIGGADDGKPIRIEHLPFWDFRPYQAIGAVMFSRQDFKSAASRFWEDALWVLGTDGLAAFDRLAAKVPATTASLRASGYYVARSAWSADADYLCFDCGEQAAGLRRDDVPSAAHGHADCLSVIVGLGGREVLVDPGFFCYNGHPDWEVHFRKTPAHNTVTIDGRDQATHIKKMAWTRTYAPALEGWSADGRIAWVSGSHDGYRGVDDIVHRRSAWLRPDGYVVLHDEVVGRGDHVIHVAFQFAPGSLESTENGVVFDNRFELAWLASAPASATTSCGGVSPDAGWIATSLGVRVAAPRVVVETRLSNGRAALLTILADRARGADVRARRVELIREGATADVLGARVAGGGFEDWVIAGPGGPISIDGIDTDARTAVVRVSRDMVTDEQRIGGSYVRVDKSRLANRVRTSAARVSARSRAEVLR
jgi:hypothetical protein